MRDMITLSCPNLSRRNISMPIPMPCSSRCQAIISPSFNCAGQMDPGSCYTTDSKVNGANMGPTWVLSAPDGPHVGPMNAAIREDIHPKIILNSNLAKSRLLIIHFSVAQSFWTFAQRTAVMLSCCVQNCKTINRKWCYEPTKFRRFEFKMSFGGGDRGVGVLYYNIHIYEYASNITKSCVFFNWLR